MFRISQDAYVLPFQPDAPDFTDYRWQFTTRQDLDGIIQKEPGSYAVTLWNRLAGKVPVAAPILTKKFRNRATAVERIWNRLAQLYPDAILPEDMPKVKEGRHATAAKKAPASRTVSKTRAAGRAGRNQEPANGTGRKSAWAEELTAELRKRFSPGDSFALADVYKLIPQFQRRHKQNNHVAARLRTTLAQDLRGAGIVKSLAKGQYRMLAGKSADA